VKRQCFNFAICLKGGVLGTVAGTIVSGVCYLAGINMDHIRYYQNEWKKQELNKEKEEMMKIIVKGENYATAPLHERDAVIGKQLTLTDLDSKNTKLNPE
jgi:putative lipase involved disintegration of autophagic bodies